MVGYRALIVVLSLSLAFLWGVLCRAPKTVPPGPSYEGQRAEAQRAAEFLETSGARNLTFVKIASRLRPSVVSIQGGRNGVQESSGTGIVVREDGYLLTNLHVIDGIPDIQVTLSSFDRYRAEVVGTDPATDLAVLHIESGENLLPVRFGDSDALEVGEEVLAIGNAYGVGWTVTQGIISNLNRNEFTESGTQDPGVIYGNFIQTDAAINPGNSGGPLVNTRGEVIGVTRLVLPGSGSGTGFGFAIPAADAAFVARELMSRGIVERGYLGVLGRSLRHVSRAERKRLGAEHQDGAVVLSVAHESPAALAGFRTGDVILSADGDAVDDYQVLRHRVARMRPGTELRFAVLRDGRTLRLTAKLTTRPKELVETPESVPIPDVEAPPFGVEVPLRRTRG